MFRNFSWACLGEFKTKEYIVHFHTDIRSSFYMFSFLINIFPFFGVMESITISYTIMVSFQTLKLFYAWTDRDKK